MKALAMKPGTLMPGACILTTSLIEGCRVEEPCGRLGARSFLVSNPEPLSSELVGKTFLN